jgi:TolA-binding protein
MLGWLLMKGAQVAMTSSSNRATAKAEDAQATALNNRISEFIDRERYSLILQEPTRYSANHLADAKKFFDRQESIALAAQEARDLKERQAEELRLAEESEEKKARLQELQQKQAVQRAELARVAELAAQKQKEQALELEKARRDESWARATVARIDADPLDLLKARKIVKLLEESHE